MAVSRGERNNNPLNIRHGSSKWQGAAQVQSDKEFVQFVDLEHGFRAAFKILKTYSARKIVSISSIISTWAPSSENDTVAYIRTVVSHLGVPYDTVIDLSDKYFACEFVRTMAFVECGKWFSPRDVSLGYIMAFS